MTFFDLDQFLPDADVLARQVVAAKKRLRKLSPSELDLATLVTDIKVSDTMKGSSTLSIGIADPEFALMDSGFFDADSDGKLDAIDVNYPEGSGLWWRLTNADVSDSPPSFELTLMERAACDMMSHKGPMKVSRAKRTRAEFLQMLAAHVKRRPIHFHSRELHKEQDKDKKPEKKAEPERKAKKERGLNTDEKITFKNWDGSEYTLKADELKNAETVLDTASGLTDDERPVLAVLCACIVEAPFFRNPAGGEGSSQGILQLTNIHPGDRRDIERVVTLFMNEGFTGKGGSIALAKDHKDWTPGEIAAEVQGPRGDLRGRYQQVIDGAKKVLAAYGGSSGGGGGTYTKQYNFEVGSPDNPHENFWDGSNRLAEEVKWALFLDGQDLYFDAETTLIKQKPVLVINRNDPAVVTWGVSWDNRNIATEMTITLICDMFEYRAGQVFKLAEGFGSASSGSTVGLPGRWLVSETERSRYEFATQFTLRQPESPAPEPAAETAQRPGSDKDADTADSDGERVGDLVYPLSEHGKSLGGVAAHKSRAWGNWQSDNAVDIGVPRGTRVFAVDDGTIVKLGGAWRGGSANPDGFNVTLKTSGRSWFYTHLRFRTDLSVGQRVKAGQFLGASGAANGVNHLHIACDHGDPESLLKV